MTESGPPLETGDVVCLVLSDLDGRVEHPFGDVYQLTLGAGAQPTVEQELIGRHVGETGRFELLNDATGDIVGVTEPTALKPLLPADATGILDQVGFETPWELIEADPEAVAAEYLLDSERVAAIQTEVANQLKGRRLVAFEIIDAYRHPATDWPEFRAGSTRRSSLSSPVTASYSPWAIELGQTINSQPAVCNGTVYLNTYGGTLYALDAASGAVRWTVTFDDAFHTSPTVFDGTVYVAGESVYAVQAADGRISWQCSINRANENAVRSTPAATSDAVFVGSEDRRLYALDRSSGTIQWTGDTGKEIQSAPAVGNETVYVSSDDGCLSAFAVGTGEIEWTYEFNKRLSVGPTSSVAVANETVYKVDGTHLWAIDAENGTERFATTDIDNAQSVPAVVDETVILAGRRGEIQALDATDGATQWTHQMEGGTRVAPAISESTIYALTTAGVLHAIDRDTHTQHWTRELDEEFATAPAVVGNIIYFGTSDGTLYALGTGTEPVSEADPVAK